MSKSETIASILILCLVAVMARVMPHIPNSAPVAAAGLFAGAHLSRRLALLVVICILLLSDYALLYVNAHGDLHFDYLYAPWRVWYGHTQIFVYFSLGLSGCIGWLLRDRRDPFLLITAALFCSIEFFLITNAAVWLDGAYARGIHGLYQSYVAGIPFFKGTVMGDLLYSIAFFGLYEMARRRDGQLQPEVLPQFSQR